MPSVERRAVLSFCQNLTETKDFLILKRKEENFDKMKKNFWTSLIMTAMFLVVWAGLFSLNQIQNKNLENKIDDLSKKISQLQNDITKQSQVAGAVATEKTDASKNQTQTKNTSPKTSSISKTQFKINSSTNSTNLTPPSLPSPTPTPTPTPQKLATVEIVTVGSYQIELQDNDTAFSILLRTGEENNFAVDYQMYEGLGAFVKCIAGICGHDNFYWAFYYNGQYSSVGASSQPVFQGDVTTWKFESW